MRILLILIMICSLSCVKKKNSYNAKDQENLNTDAELISALKPKKTPQKTEYSKMSDLFKDLPDLSVITARAGENTYLGAFYLDQNGIKMASYESSGFEISINFFEMSDHDLSVSYSLEDIGNEVKSATGEIYNFVFQISLKEMNEQLGKNPDGFFMDVEVTELTE